MKQYFLFLRTFALNVFVHPYCTCKFMSQWCHIIHRTHAQRKINFAGKCGTFGQNDNFTWILRFKAVGDPHFFFGHITFFDKFLPIVKICTKKSMLEVFFFPFSTPARSNSAHFEALQVWRCNYLKISFTSVDVKSGIYSFNRSTQINFSNASLFPMIHS